MSAKKKDSSRKRSRPTEPTSVIPKNNKTLMSIIAVILLIVIAASVYMIVSGGDSSGDTGGDNPIAVFDTTMGEFKIELYEDKTPITVANFVKLVNDGFYDGMNFYRISDDFMIQAGRYYPDGTQAQSPYGSIEFEAHPDVLHVDGAISMARSTDPNSASAEFFICDEAQRGLDDDYNQENYGQRGYTAFGACIEGLDVIHTIAAQPHDGSHPAGGGKPYEDIIINSITIE